MSYLDLRDKQSIVAYIQRLLRDLDFFGNGSSPYVINGIYTDETKNAVREFQEAYELEPTGLVDYDTWELLNYIHRTELENQMGARPVMLVPSSRPFLIEPYAVDDIMYVIQYMLNQVSTVYDELGEISLTGVFDDETQNAIRIFKRKNLLDDEPIIDAKALNALFTEYEAIISSGK
jgi:peptidoglycan hydrolase-like protein with peptidoglycan-binding domain